MKEEDLRMEIQRSMTKAGLEWYHPADTGFTEVARPDILSVSGCVIEVKRIDEKVRIEPWFDPKMIPNRQRRQLDYYSYGRGFQTYLAIGTTFGRPRRMWVIPWKLWATLERELMVENEVDAEKLRIPISELECFSQYELKWLGKGIWDFRIAHPILMLAIPRKDGEWEPKSIRFLDEPSVHSDKFH